MEEAQELSDHIGIMDHGRLIASGTNDELVKLVGQQTRIDLTLSANIEGVSSAWQEIDGVSHVSAEDGLATVLVNDSNLVLPHLFEVASHLSARITSVDIREPNLEAVFLHLTGRALRD
jgi:ABC-2 type transport system ATP-binding protein